MTVPPLGRDGELRAGPIAYCQATSYCTENRRSPALQAAYFNNRLHLRALRPSWAWVHVSLSRMVSATIKSVSTDPMVSISDFTARRCAVGVLTANPEASLTTMLFPNFALSRGAMASASVGSSATTCGPTPNVLPCRIRTCLSSCQPWARILSCMQSMVAGMAVAGRSLSGSIMSRT